MHHVRCSRPAIFWLRFLIGGFLLFLFFWPPHYWRHMVPVPGYQPGTGISFLGLCYHLVAPKQDWRSKEGEVLKLPQSGQHYLSIGNNIPVLRMYVQYISWSMYLPVVIYTYNVPSNYGSLLLHFIHSV